MAEAAERHCGLERIYFAPAAQPWHKQAPLASYVDRYAMVALALQRRPNWRPLDIPAPQEAAARAGDEACIYPPTYSVDQLTWLRRQHPGERVTFIVGADSFATLPSWKQYRKLLELCNFAVLARRGTSWEQVRQALPSDLIATAPARTRSRRGICELGLSGGGKLYWLPEFSSEASSTAARSWLSQARHSPAAAAGCGMMPAAVAAYARRARLY